MSVQLIIAEKPSVANEIAAALGGFNKFRDYFEKPGIIVTSAVGHLVEIGVNKDKDPGFKLEGLPLVPSPFDLHAIAKTKDKLDVIGRLARRQDVSCLINACDAGREGEQIFRLIVAYLKLRKPIERMWLKTMTANGIKQAYTSRRSDREMLHLADAAMCRAETDWLIGINATRALTCARALKEDVLINAGRVQTPTLAMVVDLEERIRAFVAKPFWEVLATFDFGSAAPGSWVAKHVREKQASDDKASGGDERTRFFDKTQAKQIQALCSGAAVESVHDEIEPVRKNAPLPFDLTTLQRVANVQLKLTAKQTLTIAQALYETHKVTTYPRTDSAYLPEDYPEKVRAVFKALPARFANLAQQALDKGYISDKHKVFNNNKISDHFAIIPTGKAPVGLSAHEEAVYNLIVRRFMAAFFPAAEYEKTTRVAKVKGKDFVATGNVLKTPGWLAVYGTDATLTEDGKGGEENALLPAMPKGVEVHNRRVDLKEGKTKAPSRFTEATLLGAMETAGKLVEDEELARAMSERGLGTPATRASTIEELVNREYLMRRGRELSPTDKGMATITMLKSIGLDFLTSPELSGAMEFKLAQVERGSMSRADFMRDVVSSVTSLVNTVKVAKF